MPHIFLRLLPFHGFQFRSPPDTAVGFSIIHLRTKKKETKLSSLLLAKNCSGFSHPFGRKTAYDLDCQQKHATVCQVSKAQELQYKTLPKAQQTVE